MDPSTLRMHRRCLCWLGLATLVVAMAVAPAMAQAGASSDSLLELAAGSGPAVGLGFGVSPLHRDIIAPPAAQLSGARAAEDAMPSDLESRGTALSFDITLRWPGAEPATVLEPYVVLGPALFVDRPQAGAGLLGTQADPVLRLGAKAGAGFNWRLGKDATLFGSYGITTTDVGGLTSPGAKSPAAGGIDGYDVLYGVRFRY